MRYKYIEYSNNLNNEHPNGLIVIITKNIQNKLSSYCNLFESETKLF